MRAIVLLTLLANIEGTYIGKRTNADAEKHAGFWPQHVPKDMVHPPWINATSKVDAVGLQCGETTMNVKLKIPKKFSGVIYTQGSFYSENPLCLIDAVNGVRYNMHIPLDECNTVRDDYKYSNVLVIQHDDDLLTSDDLYLYLDCEFSKPRDLTGKADLGASMKRWTKAKITLVDVGWGKDESRFVEKLGDEVVFMSEKA